MSKDWLTDADSLADMTGRKPATIRSWARRYPDRLPRRGRKDRRTLYAVEDAEKLAAELPARHGGSHP